MKSRVLSKYRKIRDIYNSFATKSTDAFVLNGGKQDDGSIKLMNDDSDDEYEKILSEEIVVEAAHQQMLIHNNNDQINKELNDNWEKMETDRNILTKCIKKLSIEGVIIDD
ncbi:unnamed protein product, partial [Adineta steineri]